MYAKSSPTTITLDRRIMIVCHLGIMKLSGPGMRIAIDLKIVTNPRKITIVGTIGIDPRKSVTSQTIGLDLRTTVTVLKKTVIV